MRSEESKRKKLSVLMPVYNERATLETIVGRVLAAPIDLELELVIVDDGSTDGSSPVMDRLAEQDARLVVFHQPVNQGKGAAVRKAIELASGDYALIQDADLEYDPRDFPALLAPLCDGRADVVYGSRFAGAEARIHLFWHQLANNWLTTLSNMLNNLNLTDMETGYKAFRMDLLKTIPIHSRSFGIEPEVTAKIARLGARIYEVPIRYHGRSYWEGKKITWKDGVVALWAMVKYSLLDPNFTTDNGLLVMQQRARAVRFNNWLMKQVKPYLGQRLLEIGAGIGTYSRFVLDSECLLLADSDSFLGDILEHNFGAMSHVEVLRGSLCSEEFYRALVGRGLDTILSVYGLERLERSGAALKACYQALEPGGRVVLVVNNRPGDQPHMDQATLTAQLRAAGFEVEEIRDLGKLPAPAWGLAERLRLPFNGLMDGVPRLFDAGEGMLPWKGMLLLAIGRKP